MWPAPSAGLIGQISIFPALKLGLDKTTFASVISIFGFRAALYGYFIL
ncbi:MAG: hypothetical protein ACPL3A_09145 [Thermoanaerobacteraceae bacterium]